MKDDVEFLKNKCDKLDKKTEEIMRMLEKMDKLGLS